MTEYYIKRLAPGKYSMAKTDADGNILDVYEQTYNSFNKVCNCSSYKQPCKHLGWLARWIDAGASPKTSVYDDVDDEFADNPFFNPNFDEDVDKFLNKKDIEL